LKDQRLLGLALGAALLLAIAGVVFVGSKASADASSLSRASGGWLAARRYLEERGTRVTLLDHPLDEPIGRGLLILAFPWQHLAIEDVPQGLTGHLQRGNAVLFAYTDHPDGMEDEVTSALGLSSWDRRPPPPLRPRRWWAYASEEWTLTGEGAEAGRDVRIAALRKAPGAPMGARVLLRDVQGRAMAFSYARWRGRVTVVPADVFSNARLGHPGNADFLEALRDDEAASAWLFDEFHHGLHAAPGAESTGPQRGLLLYVLQVVFVYALCAWAVARRFGPAWRETVWPGGSAAGFLVGLGAWHARLGHHREAARLLLARAQELDPRIAGAVLPADDGRDLLALARRIGAWQSGKDRSS
jgi:hypothetical protein